MHSPLLDPLDLALGIRKYVLVKLEIALLKPLHLEIIKMEDTGWNVSLRHYYQTDLYKVLGITGHTVTLLASIYGMVGPIANVVCLYFVDSWGRKKTLWITGIIMALDMALVMAMTGAYSHTTNVVGKGFGIAFIFYFSIM